MDFVLADSGLPLRSFVVREQHGAVEVEVNVINFKNMPHRAKELEVVGLVCVRWPLPSVIPQINDRLSQKE